MKSSKLRLSLLLFLLILCPISGLFGCRSSYRTKTDAPLCSDNISFSSYTELLFQKEVQSDTLSLHYVLSNPKEYGISDYTIALPDYSEDARLAASFSTENLGCALASYPYDSLSKEEQLTYDILKDSQSSMQKMNGFSLYQEVLRPSTGFPAQLPVLLSEYRFQNRQDVEDYLALLEKIPDCFTSICCFEQAKADAGLFMSDTQADTLINDINALCDTTKEHYLITTFSDKIEALSDLTAEEKADYCQRNETLFNECFLPAYEHIRDTLCSLKGMGTNDAGLCYYSDGLAYYTQLVSDYTGSSRSIDELLELTKSQRYEDMLAISLLLKENPDLTTAVTSTSLPASSPEEILTFLTSAVTDRFPQPAATEFSVNYVTECMQDCMAPAFYLTAPMDDLSHNVIYINPKQQMQDVDLFTTLAHEGFPGHLYQTTKTASAGLPSIRFLLNYPGYVEGWATYVEMISYSYLGIDEKQAALLMHNQSALLSLYATADLSIHAKGWTEDDLYSFLAGYGITDRAVCTDIYRYIVSEPAHYLKYYIGYLEFLELKKDAKELLGDKFSETDFHDAILKIGPAPFDILRKYILE